MDQHLLVFVTVVEKGNFSRAAEELHMTQPAVSQYIQLLERSYGTKLLERNNKFVRLNKAGEIVYSHAKEIIGLYSKMKSLIDDLSSHAGGPLSIGSSYTFGEYVLPHFIARLHKQFPDVKPSITIGNTKEIAELVLGHQLDIGIIEGDYNKVPLKIEPFAEDTMFIVASSQHRLAQQDTVDISELEKETWIVREQGSGTREAVEKVFQNMSITPTEIMEFGSTQLIKESVESGLGITFLSQLTFRKEVSMGLLKTLSVTNTIPFKRNFSIVLRTSFKTKALEVFIELLKEHHSLSTVILEDDHLKKSSHSNE